MYLNLRESLPETVNEWSDQSSAQLHGGADSKHALDRGSLGGSFSLRFGDIGNNACAPFIKTTGPLR
jgi:hypothetical protein